MLIMVNQAKRSGAVCCEEADGGDVRSMRQTSQQKIRMIFCWLDRRKNGEAACSIEKTNMATIYQFSAMGA